MRLPLNQVDRQRLNIIYEINIEKKYIQKWFRLAPRQPVAKWFIYRQNSHALKIKRLQYYKIVQFLYHLIPFSNIDCKAQA